MLDDLPLVEKKVIETIADTLDIDKSKITLESKLTEDLGIDSIKAIEVIFAIEGVFQMRFNDEDIRKIKRVGEIIDYITKK